MKSKVVFSLVMVLLCGVLLSACSSGASSAGLMDSDWELVSINDNPPVPGRSINLIFEKDSLGGSSGCNSYGGEYKITGDKISIGPVAMTEMACMEPGVMEQEALFGQILSNAQSFNMNDGRLTITDGDGNTLVFAALMKL